MKKGVAASGQPGPGLKPEGPEGEGSGDAYREVGLVDAQEENQLSQAQGGGQVAADAMLVGSQSPQQGEEEEGEQQGSQSDPESHVGQCLQRQDLPILYGEHEEGKNLSARPRAPTFPNTCNHGRRKGLAHLPPGHIHEHSEARHVVALAADMALVAENNLTATG